MSEQFRRPRQMKIDALRGLMAMERGTDLGSALHAYHVGDIHERSSGGDPDTLRDCAESIRRAAERIAKQFESAADYLEAKE